MLTYATSMECAIAVLYSRFYRDDAGQSPFVRPDIRDCLKCHCIEHAILNEVLAAQARAS